MTLYATIAAFYAASFAVFWCEVRNSDKHFISRQWRPVMRSHFNVLRQAWEYVQRFVYEHNGVRVVVWDVSQRQADLRYAEWFEKQEKSEVECGDD